MLWTIVAASALATASATSTADHLEDILATTARAEWTHRTDQQVKALSELRFALYSDCIVKTERAMVDRKGWVEDIAGAVLRACSRQEEALAISMDFSMHAISDDFDRAAEVRSMRAHLRSGSIEGIMAFLARHR